MAWEEIKINLWKGGLNFSKFFPAAGHIVGLGFALNVIDKSFPKIRRR